MTTNEIGMKLVELCKEGKFVDAVKSLYADDVVSVEAGGPPGMPREMQGLPAVLGKGEWWVNAHEIHSTVVEGPLVAGSTFCVKFKMDVTQKEAGKRYQMEELALYKVKDGKVVREEFFYDM